MRWSSPIRQTTAAIPIPIVRDGCIFFSVGCGQVGVLPQQVVASGGKVTVNEI